ncbi:MAG: hemin-degrading factor, partial [Burkholderiaceae bacterium]|nr:hemin-degrading factor [Burkholderiaceae bacterium]
MAAGPCEHLREAYLTARRAGASRHRDIAAHLGVSEGELIAAHVSASPQPQGLRAQRLRADWPRLIAALETVGPVMALTRNTSCVHEKTGIYCNTSANGPAGREMGLVVGGDIDLRVFYSRWAHGFAVDEAGDKGVQRSLQFFDASGMAVHKVFVKPATDLAAWDRLVVDFTDAQGAPGLELAAPPVPAAQKPDAEIDVKAFRQAWASMRDTHEFFGLLRTHGVTRTQALRLAEARFVRPVDAASAQQVLSGAASTGTPIMVFVGNPGMIQIHTGPVNKVVVMGPWLNVLDPGFNLHLREDHIASAWVVRKPTSDGLVTSLELFDAQGDTIAMFFGERKPGRPELCVWRELIDGLVGDRVGFEEAPCLP